MKTEILYIALGAGIVLISAFMVWNHKQGDGVMERGVSGVEGFEGADGGGDGGDGVNLVAEQGHFRQQLDQLDKRAAANPGDKALAAQRQELEAMLTEIADFIQREGKVVRGEDADRLVMKIRKAML